MGKIILISGKARHGKNTFANFCREYLEDKNYKVLELAFADYLKYFCKQYLNWNGVKDEKGRRLLQLTGDELRYNNPDIFVNILKELLKSLKNNYDYIFITDCRFKNEIKIIQQEFPEETKVIRINRTNFISHLTEVQQNHKSETDLDDYNFDIILCNDSTLDKFRKISINCIKDI